MKNPNIRSWNAEAFDWVPEAMEPSRGRFRDTYAWIGFSVCVLATATLLGLGIRAVSSIIL